MPAFCPRKKESRQQEGQSRASLLVAAFCKEHSVGAKTFQALTVATLLPHLDHNAAMMLLEKEGELLLIQDAPLSCLQLRCIDAFAQNFSHIDMSETSPVHQQSRDFMFKLLVQVQSHNGAREMDLEE
jgi:hypothetical protein